jgi:primosomal replication protein N
MNHLVLAASLVERGAKRYTPAGLPALDLRLQSDTTVTQNGQARKVSVELRAVVIGDLTLRIERLALGSTAQFAGFIAPGRSGKGLFFHVTELQDVPTSAPSAVPS